MAQELKARNAGFNCFVRLPQPIEHKSLCKDSYDVNDLYKSYILLGSRIKSRRPPTCEQFRGVVGRDVVSVSARIVHLLKRLLREGQNSFYSLFDDANGRSQVVATFLAMLELVKSKNIIISDDEVKTVILRRHK
jgi:segregation and condensation protein A